MNLYFDRKPILDVNQSLELYNEKEFSSPTRSTILFLSLLKDDENLFIRIMSEIGLSGNPEVHLEYKVYPTHEKKGASQTDAMVITEKDILAIEAKWTEPRYNSVKKWLHQGRYLNRRERVIKGWLTLLEEQCSKAFNVDEFLDVPYQMVHRAASACSTDKTPKLAYLQFLPLIDNSSKSEIINDLTNLWHLLGYPDIFPFYYIEVDIETSQSYNLIKNLPKKSMSTRNEVIASLVKGNLFYFTLLSITRIE